MQQTPGAGDYQQWCNAVSSFLQARRPDVQIRDLDRNFMWQCFSQGMPPLDFVIQSNLRFAAQPPQATPPPPAPPPPQPQVIYGIPAQQVPYRSDRIQKPPGEHSVVVAVVLCFCCIAGAAQMYNGQVVKGVVLLIFSILGSLATGGLIMLLVWPLAIIDGIIIASKVNSGHSVGLWDFC